MGTGLIEISVYNGILGTIFIRSSCIPLIVTKKLWCLLCLGWSIVVGVEVWASGK